MGKIIKSAGLILIALGGGTAAIGIALFCHGAADERNEHKWPNRF